MGVQEFALKFPNYPATIPKLSSCLSMENLYVKRAASIHLLEAMQDTPVIFLTDVNADLKLAQPKRLSVGYWINGDQ